MTHANVNQYPGVKGVETRSGVEREFLADAVVLATSGFQSNLKMIRDYWPKSLPLPARVLAGSGINSLGIGHAMLRVLTDHSCRVVDSKKSPISRLYAAGELSGFDMQSLSHHCGECHLSKD